jgi:hypothetical protein
MADPFESWDRLACSWTRVTLVDGPALPVENMVRSCQGQLIRTGENR